MRHGRDLGVEDGLGDAIAVAQVDEDQPAEVAPAIDPALQRHPVSRAPRAQGATRNPANLNG